ncbi:hypothetical protein AAMO2058_001456900 [Amorphochlora amoebiformis]
MTSELEAGRHLTDQQVSLYLRDGYVVVKKHLSEKVVNGLIKSLKALEAKVPLKQSPFKSQVKGSAKPLIESAHQVVGFSAGPKAPIQQIGHNLHGLVPEFERLCYHDDVYAVARDLGVVKPAIVQSKVVCKPARHGWKVPIHSDEQYIYTDPLSGFGLWWALDR